jgi:energy-coupling factor transporter ATP-binding protein EcfA2
MGSIYGYELESELPLRRLRDSPGLRGRLRLERGTEELLDQPGELIAWQDWGPDGNRFALVRCEQAFLASWTLAGTFEIDPTAGRIRVVTPTFSEQRLATTVIPLLLAERGDLVLHASVVAVDGRALLFCGPSGCGKSTLALLASQLGHGVLSDDGAVVEMGAEAALWPGLHGVVVEDDVTTAGRNGARAVHTKAPVAAPRRRRVRMLAAGRDAAGPAPLAALCEVAERGADLRVRRLSPTEAIAALTPSLIHAGSPDSLRPAFSLLARLVERAPAYRVAMPDGIERATAATARLLGEVVTADPAANPAL